MMYLSHRIKPNTHFPGGPDANHSWQLTHAPQAPGVQGTTCRQLQGARRNALNPYAVPIRPGGKHVCFECR